MFMVNVAKYTIHGSYGNGLVDFWLDFVLLFAKKGLVDFAPVTWGKRDINVSNQ